MNKNKFICIRISDDFREELDKVLSMMDEKFGFNSSKSWKIRWLLSLGCDSVKEIDIVAGGRG